MGESHRLQEGEAMTFNLRTIGMDGGEYELAISISGVEITVVIDDEDLEELKKEIKRVD